MFFTDLRVIHRFLCGTALFEDLTIIGHNLRGMAPWYRYPRLVELWLDSANEAFEAGSPVSVMKQSA